MMMRLSAIKSTSIKFKNNVKIFVGICYGLCVLLLFALSLIVEAEKFFYILLTMLIVQFLYQTKTFKKDNPDICLKIFRSNNYVGILIFLTVATLNL